MAKVATPTKPLTKTELLANIAATTELPKAQVAAVLEALGAEIQKSLSNKGAGAVTIPGLVKIEKKKVPARKAGSIHGNQRCKWWPVSTSVVRRVGC